MASFTLEEWQDGALRVHCADRPWSGDIAVYLMKRDASGARSVARFSDFSDPVPQHQLLPPEPSFSIPSGMAKNLMDELWRAGIRPSEGVPSGDAQTAHLQDMRAIAFAKLNVEMPK